MNTAIMMTIFGLLTAGQALAGAPAQTPELVAKGKAAYATSCVVCHGDNGTGNGPAGMALNPKPRDFTTGQFKNGAAPDQLFKTISTGLPNTPMVGFSSLPEEDRWGLVYYVKSFKK